MKAFSLRKRVTIIVVILLIVNTIILAVVLNISALKMTNMIEIRPSYDFEEEVAATKLLPSKNMSLLESVIEESRQVFKLESILYSSLVIILGGVITYFLVGHALKPISQLSQQVNRINVQNLNEQLDYINTKDEISDLAKSFNNMTDKLARSVKFQGQFSSNVAHELKTPLAILQTKIDIFRKKGLYTDSEYKKLIKIFERNTRRLSDLVNDLMIFSSQESLVLENELNFKNIVEHVMDDLSSVAEERDVSLSVFGQDMLVYGNENLLNRLLFNLIENAIKYNKVDGAVKVELSSTVTENTVKVIDTGEGIPDAFKKKVFDAFYQVDQSRNDSGVGLGLSIAFNIVEKYNGRIDISDNKPVGSIFQVTLPKVKKI